MSAIASEVHKTGKGEGVKKNKIKVKIKRPFESSIMYIAACALQSHWS